MAVYNVSKIEDWYNDFISCRKKFIDVYLDDYQNCYVKQCKDDIANMMRVSLNDNYNKINRLFNNINTFWNNYLNDLKNTDNYMAGTSSAGAINSSSVQAKLKTLPTLATYEVTLDIKTSSIVTNTKNWWNNNKDTMAVYGMEIFCDVADLVEQFSDGIIYAIGGAYTGFNTLIGNEEEASYAEESFKEQIALDWTSEMKESFYSTELGREINANSKVKYDSETMSNFSEKFTKISDTVFAIIGQGIAGGIVGGVMGGGDAVESYLQENPDASLSDAFSSALVGGLKKGSEYYAKGSLFKGGMSFLKGFKSAFTKGGTKTLFSSLSKAFTKEGAKQNISAIGSKISQTFSKSNIVETLKLALKDPDTWLDSLGTASDHIIIDEKTGDAYIDNWKEFFRDASLGFFLNYIFKTGDVKVSSSGTSSSVMDELTDDLRRNYNLDEIDQKVLSGEAKSSIKNKIDDAFNDIKKNFSDFKTAGQTKLSGAKSSISDWFSSLRTNLDDVGSKISKKLNSILDDIKPNKLNNMVDDVITNTRASNFNNENPNQFSWDWSSKKEADALKKDGIPILEKYKVNTSSPEYQASWNNSKSSSGKEGLLGKENPLLKNNDNLNTTSTKTSIKNKIDDAFSNIRKSVDEFKTKSNTSFSNSKSKISDWFSNIRNNLDETSSKLTSKFKNAIDDSSSAIRNKIDDAFSNIRKSVDEFKTKSNTSFSNSKSKISDWFSNIRNNLDETSSKLTSKFKSILDGSNLKKSSDAVKTADNIIDEATYNQLLKKREELLAKTKEDWFISEQEYMKNNNGMGTSNSVAYYNLTRQLDEINDSLKNSKIDSSNARTFKEYSTIYTQKTNNDIYKVKNYQRNKNLINNFKKGNDIYGGNQGSLLDLYKKHFKNKTDKYELQLIEDTIRKYYPNMSNSEMEKFLKRINDSGCTYVATANSIFEQLNYDSKLFKEKFGFDMYLPNGELNQNQLIADIYASMSKKVKVMLRGTIDSQTYNSCSAAAKEIFDLDLNEHDAMIKLFTDSRNLGYYVEGGGLNLDGTITLKKYTNYSNADYYVGTPEDIVDRFLGKNIDVNNDNLEKVLKDNGINATVTNPTDGEKIYTLTNDESYLSEYLNSKGMKLTGKEKSHIYNNVSDMVNDLNHFYEEGYSISVMGRSISMTDGSKFGWVTLGQQDGHAMILRGITDNGDVIVSSWGKYYCIPSDNISNLEFYFTKIGDKD